MRQEGGPHGQGHRIQPVRRPIIAALLLVGLLLAPAAEARMTLPALFTRQIRAIKGVARPPAVLLPATMPLDAAHLYASGGRSGSGYDLAIGAVRGCGGADACFVAEFTASRTTAVFGRRVKVRGASRAGFAPLSCGASCSPPQIDFVVRGVRYTIQANLRTSRGDRAALVQAAQDAIAAGPR
jgi:hypothetical protein